MKKILISLCILFTTGFALAQDLTVGDTLTIYFSELFPIVYMNHNDVILKYTDIGSNKPGLRSALQRGIYYGMIANASSPINPDNPMKDKVFAALSKQHFGVTIATDDSYLTLSDYQNFMKGIRLSFAYHLLQKINASSSQNTPVTDIPAVSQLGSTKKYYILDEVYKTIKDNHLNASTLSEDNLVYGAAK